MGECTGKLSTSVTDVGRRSWYNLSGNERCICPLTLPETHSALMLHICKGIPCEDTEFCRCEIAKDSRPRTYPSVEVCSKTCWAPLKQPLNLGCCAQCWRKTPLISDPRGHRASAAEEEGLRAPLCADTVPCEREPALCCVPGGSEEHRKYLLFQDEVLQLSCRPTWAWYVA